MDVRSTRQQLFNNRLKVLRRNFCLTGVTSYFPIYLQAMMVGEKLSFTLQLLSANR